MRLDRYLAQCTALPRSEAQRLIKQKRVALDGTIHNRPSAQVGPDAVVTLDGVAIRPHGHHYLLLHKPAGYECTQRPGVHPPVYELLLQDFPEARELHFAGRLDVDSTGLLLLTTDGAWSHCITSPRHKRPKTYRVGLAEPVTEAAAAQLRDGVLLRGEAKPTRPAAVERLDDHALRLTLIEGRYHQVKRMLAAVGNRVTRLHRERIGSWTLEELQPGQWRALSPEEIADASGNAVADQSRHV